jgi:hypothetical protein
VVAPVVLDQVQVQLIELEEVVDQAAEAVQVLALQV